MSAAPASNASNVTSHHGAGEQRRRFDIAGQQSTRQPGREPDSRGQDGDECRSGQGQTLSRCQ